MEESSSEEMTVYLGLKHNFKVKKSDAKRVKAFSSKMSQDTKVSGADATLYQTTPSSCEDLNFMFKVDHEVFQIQNKTFKLLMWN